MIINATRTVIVNRLPGGSLLVQCSLLSTFEEASVWVSVDPSNLEVASAAMEVYRSNREKPRWVDLPQLKGLKAYFDSGPQLKNALVTNPIARELVGECIKGIIQAEPWVCEERGWASQQAYLDDWAISNANYCHNFTYPEEEDWSVPPRQYNLFNRSEVTTLNMNNDRILASSIFIDTWHEMYMELKCSMDGVVVSATTSMIRLPHPGCRNGDGRINNLLGWHLTSNKRDIAALIGGPEGCVHLVDMVYAAGQLIDEAREAGLIVRAGTPS